MWYVLWWAVGDESVDMLEDNLVSWIHVPVLLLVIDHICDASRV